MKELGGFLCAIVLILLLFVAIGWITLPFQQVSVENVQKQWAFAYQYDEALQASARQVCAANRALQAATLQEELIQRRSQVLAYEQNYARIQAEYNQKLRNAFEAKYVKPSDVPTSAPELSEMKLKVCPVQ